MPYLSSSAETEKPDIQILKYGRDTRDTYGDVRQLSKEIFAGTRALFSHPSLTLAR